MIDHFLSLSQHKETKFTANLFLRGVRSYHLNYDTTCALHKAIGRLAACWGHNDEASFLLDTAEKLTAHQLLIKEGMEPAREITHCDLK